MITTCTECQARYQLDASKIPPRVIKVRCPACSGIFSLDGSQARNDEVAPAKEPVGVTSGYGDFTPPPASERPTDEPAPAPAEETVAVSAPSSEPAVSKDYAAAPAATVEPSVAVSEPATEVAVMDPPVEKKSRRRRSKEEMLARALVSDIMVYNRDLYEQAKAENNLLEALGAEIKKSWELYKEKVTPEVANSTNHFRDALNEILADGENIF